MYVYVDTCTYVHIYIYIYVYQGLRTLRGLESFGLGFQVLLWFEAYQVYEKGVPGRLP